MQGGHATRDDLGVRAAAAPPGTVTERDEARLTRLTARGGSSSAGIGNNNHLVINCAVTHYR